jgi:hypothetical protein
VKWRDYGGLRVGLAGRLDLIYLKLFAAADEGRTGRHSRDLLALAATDKELEAAARWVKRQDANTKEFAALVDNVVTYVRKSR